MSAPKNVTRFHYQDIIYLSRPQSLAIVLVVINSSIDRLSSTQRMPPPVNQRIQDGGLRPPVLKGSRFSIMLRHHPRLKDGGFKMADDLSYRRTTKRF